MINRDSLDFAFDNAREADAVLKLMAVTLDYFEDGNGDAPTLNDVADLVVAMGLVRKRIGTVLEFLGNVEVDLRAYARWSQNRPVTETSLGGDRPQKRERDPIVAAIDALRIGFEDYRTNAPDDDAGAAAYADASYRRPLNVIEKWDRPAETIEGVVAALTLAKQAGGDGNDEVVAAMVGAALDYFTPRSQCAQAS